MEKNPNEALLHIEVCMKMYVSVSRNRSLLLLEQTVSHMESVEIPRDEQDVTELNLDHEVIMNQY